MNSRAEKRKSDEAAKRRSEESARKERERRKAEALENQRKIMKAAKADCDEQINQVITLTMEQECLLDTSIVPIFGVRGFIPMGVFPWFLALCMFGFVAFGIALGVAFERFKGEVKSILAKSKVA